MSCTVDDCEAPRVRRGWCAKHFRRWQVWGDPCHGDIRRLTRVERLQLDMIRQCATPGCARAAADADRWCVPCELAGKPWQQMRRPAPPWFPHYAAEPAPSPARLEQTFGQPMGAGMVTLQTYSRMPPEWVA